MRRQSKVIFKISILQFYFFKFSGIFECDEQGVLASIRTLELELLSSVPVHDFIRVHSSLKKGRDAANLFSHDDEFSHDRDISQSFLNLCAGVASQSPLKSVHSCSSKFFC